MFHVLQHVEIQAIRFLFDHTSQCGKFAREVFDAMGFDVPLHGNHVHGCVVVHGASVMPVVIMDGATALTVMPRAPGSLAKAWVITDTAALLAA